MQDDGKHETISISLEPGVSAGPHEHWRTMANVNGMRRPFLVGKYNAFIPNFDGPWGLKILRNWPTETTRNGKVLLLDTGLMPDPGIASDNLRRKAEELIDLYNLMDANGLAPAAHERIVEIHFDEESLRNYRNMLQSQRWRGGDKFWGFRVKSVKLNRPRLMEFRPHYRSFRSRLESLCIRNNVRRRLSTSIALKEFLIPGNSGYALGEGYRVVDIDLGNSFGPRIYPKEKIVDYISKMAQFPENKRKHQYQSLELDGEIVEGGRAAASKRLESMGVDFSIFQGASVIDLGCNVGGFCFLAKNSGAEYTLGVDINDHAIEGAKLIRDYQGLTGMDFLTASLDDWRLKQVIRSVAGRNRFDVVFAMSIAKHVRQPNMFHYAMRKLTSRNQEPFYKFLRRLTGKYLLFEGHGKTAKEQYLEPLKHNFREVRFLGYSTDRNPRAFFMAES